MELTVIIPARNEEQTLSSTIRQLESVLNPKHSIIVVNDHSSDRTVSLVLELQREYFNLKLVHNDGAPGFTNTLKKGFSTVSSGAVVPVMADMCDDPSTIPLMLDKIKEGYDAVCGSRYMRGARKSGGRLLQNIFSWLVNTSLQLLTNIPTHDVSNAFKMYRIEALHSIEIEEAGFASSMEIIVKLYKKGFKIGEVPTFWQGRKAGRSKFRMLSVARSYMKWYIKLIF